MDYRILKSSEEAPTDLISYENKNLYARYMYVPKLNSRINLPHNSIIEPVERDSKQLQRYEEKI